MPEQSKKVAQQKHRFETVAASSRVSDANSDGSDERFSSGRKPSSSSDSRSESNAEVLSENHLSSTSIPEY